MYFLCEINYFLIQSLIKINKICPCYTYLKLFFTVPRSFFFILQTEKKNEKKIKSNEKESTEKKHQQSSFALNSRIKKIRTQYQENKKKVEKSAKRKKREWGSFLSER